MDALIGWLRLRCIRRTQQHHLGFFMLALHTGYTTGLLMKMSLLHIGHCKTLPLLGSLVSCCHPFRFKDGRIPRNLDRRKPSLTVRYSQSPTQHHRMCHAFVLNLFSSVQSVCVVLWGSCESHSEYASRCACYCC